MANSFSEALFALGRRLRGSKPHTEEGAATGGASSASAPKGNWHDYFNRRTPEKTKELRQQARQARLDEIADAERLAAAEERIAAARRAAQGAHTNAPPETGTAPPSPPGPRINLAEEAPEAPRNNNGRMEDLEEARRKRGPNAVPQFVKEAGDPTKISLEEDILAGKAFLKMFEGNAAAKLKEETLKPRLLRIFSGLFSGRDSDLASANDMKWSLTDPLIKQRKKIQDLQVQAARANAEGNTARLSELETELVEARRQRDVYSKLADEVINPEWKHSSSLQGRGAGQRQWSLWWRFFRAGTEKLVGGAFQTITGRAPTTLFKDKPASEEDFKKLYGRWNGISRMGDSFVDYTNSFFRYTQPYYSGPQKNGGFLPWATKAVIAYPAAWSVWWMAGTGADLALSPWDTKIPVINRDAAEMFSPVNMGKYGWKTGRTVGNFYFSWDSQEHPVLLNGETGKKLEQKILADEKDPNTVWQSVDLRGFAKDGREFYEALRKIREGQRGSAGVREAEKAAFALLTKENEVQQPNGTTKKEIVDKREEYFKGPANFLPKEADPKARENLLGALKSEDASKIMSLNFQDIYINPKYSTDDLRAAVRVALEQAKASPQELKFTERLNGVRSNPNSVAMLAQLREAAMDRSQIIDSRIPSVRSAEERLINIAQGKNGEVKTQEAILEEMKKGFYDPRISQRALNMAIEWLPSGLRNVDKRTGLSLEQPYKVTINTPTSARYSAIERTQGPVAASTLAKSTAPKADGTPPVADALTEDAKEKAKRPKTASADAAPAPAPA